MRALYGLFGWDADAPACTTQRQRSTAVQPEPEGGEGTAAAAVSLSRTPPAVEAMVRADADGGGACPQPEAEPGDPGGGEPQAEPGGSAPLDPREAVFRKALDQPHVDLEEIRRLGWKSIPRCIRPESWRLLLGYLPTSRARQPETLRRKRSEYLNYISKYFDQGEFSRDESELQTFHQIEVDVPRTSPGVPLFQEPRIQEMLTRILYIWAIRHPASGYVQGMNDLVVPFICVFLSEYVGDADVPSCDVTSVSKACLDCVEADSFWCVTKLLDSIQDNYTFAQPGIQRMIFKLKEVVNCVDKPLYRHLEAQQVEFIQFSFRWMNCLLLREMELDLCLRLWDTYLAEGDGFSTFHVYVCAAFLCQFSARFLKLEFQELLMLFQNLAHESWLEGAHSNQVALEMVLAQA